MRGFLRRWLPPLMGGLLLLSAQAQRAPALGLAPPFAELELAPGERYEGIIRLVMAKKGEGQFEVQPLDFEFDDAGQLVVEPPGMNPYSASDWLQFSADPFALSEGKVRTFTYAVEVPPSARGSYWSAIAFTPVVNPEQSGGQVSVQIRTQVLFGIYITTTGGQSPAFAIDEAGLREGRLEVLVSNRGNTYLALGGTVRFLDDRGRTVAQKPFPKFLLLRDASRVFRFDPPPESRAAVIEVRDRKGKLPAEARAVPLR